mmetsp:Transcript_33950/g.25033  ORF Transcript_33950/g.25033 Transcript_33950/m.25033 type:complete len:135 (+) Transcript_33950:953-1357(+)
MFCYYCYYYIKVVSNYTLGNSEYLLTMQRFADSGTSIKVLPLNTQTTGSMTSTGQIVQSKFIFNSKAPFKVILSVLQGEVNASISLYPDAPISGAIWNATTKVGTKTIEVKQTNLNFHIGAWYYLTITAINGKT